jgi:hypothetical protein
MMKLPWPNTVCARAVTYKKVLKEISSADTKISDILTLKYDLDLEGHKGYMDSTHQFFDIPKTDINGH